MTGHAFTTGSFQLGSLVHVMACISAPRGLGILIHVHTTSNTICAGGVTLVASRRLRSAQTMKSN